jgi:hypothetical protein
MQDKINMLTEFFPYLTPEVLKLALKDKRFDAEVWEDTIDGFLVYINFVYYKVYVFFFFFCCFFFLLSMH